MIFVFSIVAAPLFQIFFYIIDNLRLRLDGITPLQSAPIYSGCQKNVPLSLPELIALYFGRDVLRIFAVDRIKMLSLTGELKKIGILDIDTYDLKIGDEFLTLFQNPNDKKFSQNFYFKIKAGSVPLENYFFKKEQIDHVLKLLQKKTDTSTHILLYGPPGTGKTSFAYSLKKHLKDPAYEIVRGDENTASKRRAAILACLNLTNTGDGSLIVVDEADNILNTQNSWLSRGETQDKGWLNQLLETPGIRIIWITNSIAGIEDSVLLRFVFSLHFKMFNRRQRVELWNNILVQNKCKRFFTPAAIETFVKRYNLYSLEGLMRPIMKSALLPTKIGFISVISLSI